MAFHLAHPSLTTTGKSRSKRKFRSAAAAKQARDNADSWKALLKQHGVNEYERKRARAMDAKPWKPEIVVRRGDNSHIPSREVTWATCARPADKVYTGDKVIGISTLHKSNAVPVFSREEAIEISKMRRG